MKLLLDTSAFLWWISDHASLSQRARDLISDGNHEVWFSAVSSWEIVIKAGLGRLQLPENAERFLPKQIGANGFQVLPIHLRHTLRVARLPDLHRDPFDRLLIAQAILACYTEPRPCHPERPQDDCLVGAAQYPLSFPKIDI